MTVYATLIRMTAEEITGMTNAQKALNEADRVAAATGIKIIGSYATLGPYDVMLIYDAPNERVAANMSMSIMAKLGGHPETWTLIPASEIPKIVDNHRT